MSAPITIKLTRREAQELSIVAQNGYGDGDFYGLNNRRKTTPTTHRAQAFNRAIAKLNKARGVS